MGMRWDDEKKSFDPLPPWAIFVMGMVVGFVLAVLITTGPVSG